MDNNKQITYEEWCKIYLPETDDEGEIIDYSNIIPVPKFSNHIWTEVSGDFETTSILPGVHLVNKTAIYFTSIPWENVNIEVNCNTTVNIDTLQQFLSECYTTIEHKINSNSDKKLSFDELLSQVLSTLDKKFNKGLYILSHAKYSLIDVLEKHTKLTLDDDLLDEIDSFFYEKDLELL